MTFTEDPGGTPGRSAPRWAIGLALVLALGGLSACGSSGGGSSSTSGSAPSGGTKPAADSATPWCGDKPITLGIQDGGGSNGWSKASLEQVKLEASQCPAVKKTIVVNANFDPQKAISGLQSLVAQGANAIVIIPDAAGKAELPGIRSAFQHGVKIVPWGSSVGGTPGKDYVDFVDWDPKASAAVWADWMVKQLGGKGNVIYLGGIAGGEVGLGELAGMVSVFDKNPGINLLTGKKSFPATNWDPAQTTKVMSGLLPKYPKIDGIIVDNGTGAAAVVRVLKAAGRKVPPIAALEANEAGCLWKDEKGSFDLATTSARNWMGRIAVRKAVAAVNGIDYKEKSIIPLPLFEDSTGTNKPQCDPSKAPDALLSNNLPTAELNKLSGAPATLK